MRLTYMYRLNPTHHQRTILYGTLELCRWVYNETLATRKHTWEDQQKALSLYDTKKLLTGWKVEKPELSQVHSQVLQNVQDRVDLAFKAFFGRVKGGAEKFGYPRFKGRGPYDSFTYPQSGFAFQHYHLSLSKIGLVKIIYHRPIEGKTKVLTIQRHTVGNWYACFACEVAEQPLLYNDSAAGINFGLESFAMLSTGEKVANPRLFRQDEKELAKAQRKRSAAEKCTPEHRKQ